MKKIVSAMLIAVLLISSVVTALGATIVDEENNSYYEPLNSWRYKNGVPIKSGLTSTGASSLKAWSKTDKGYVNSLNQVIPGATMKGIDVSQWNGDIDWATVKKTDVEYAIIRCGYGSNYTSQDDTKFKRNIEGCIKNKIPFGVYLYSYATNKSMAKSEAEHVLRLIKGYKLDFPVYYDLEDNSQTGLSKSTIGTMAKTFCNTISEKGYKVGIYANLYWWNNYLTDKAFENSSWYKWIAQYNYKCDYKGKYEMWQATSSAYVKGCGTTDVNFWFGKKIYSSYAKPVTLNTSSIKATRYYNNITKQLSASVNTSDGNKKVKWYTSNSNVATVSSTGLVTLVGGGNCVITAKAEYDKTKMAKCTVSVTQKVVEIDVNKENITFNKPGETYKITPVLTPSRVSNKGILWESTDTSVAVVNSMGIVTAKGKGDCSIMLTTKDGTDLTVASQVSVKNSSVTKVSLNKSNVKIKVNKSYKLKAVCTPKTAYNKAVTFKSSNTRIATVSSGGTVKGKKVGTCYITATAKDGSKKSAKCKVNVVR